MYEAFEDLNRRENEILDFIRKFIQEVGYPPTVRDICNGTGIPSTSSVHTHLKTLEEKGYLRRDSQKTRALELIVQSDVETFAKKKTVDIPVVGRVTAGTPILATEYIEDTFPVSEEMSERGATFILNVSGDSMIEAGIFDGDRIVVREQNTANNGEIVVALIDDSATVKRFYKKDGKIILKPENSTMEPMIFDNVIILGKVIGLYRSYEG